MSGGSSARMLPQDNHADECRVPAAGALEYNLTSWDDPLRSHESALAVTDRTHGNVPLDLQALISALASLDGRGCRSEHTTNSLTIMVARRALED